MHENCGTWETHGTKYWDEFCAGKFDFDEFARLDVASWKNQPYQKLLQTIAQVQITPGFTELMEELNKRAITTAVISGTIGQFAEHLQARYGITHLFANPLGITEDLLNGSIELQVPGEGKSAIAKALIKKLQLPASEVAVVGDSQFDIPMFAHAHHSFIINNEKYKSFAKYFIKDFHEIVNLL